MKNEVISVVCRAMFGKERVNKSGPPFQGIGRLFSWSNFSVCYCNSVTLREDFVYNCHTSKGAKRHGYAALRTTCAFHGTYSYTLLLQLAVTDA